MLILLSYLGPGEISSKTLPNAAHSILSWPHILSQITKIKDKGLTVFLQVYIFSATLSF